MTYPRPTCRFTKDADYAVERFVFTPVGNNAVFFDERKKAGSDCILRIPPLITGTIDDVRIDPNPHHICYEQYDRGRVIAS
jgi:hypothetical protein